MVREIRKNSGFTEEEAKQLCEEHHSDFQMMKQWYDGYTFPGIGAVYNPGSVMEAIRNDDFDSYWTRTSAAESLMGYISLDFDGLSKTIAELIGGDILLVGINYDKDAPAGKRKHSCVIEKHRI